MRSIEQFIEDIFIGAFPSIAIRHEDGHIYLRRIFLRGGKGGSSINTVGGLRTSIDPMRCVVNNAMGISRVYIHRRHSVSMDRVENNY